MNHRIPTLTLAHALPSTPPSNRVDPHDLIREALRASNTAAVARHCGVSPALVRGWRTGKSLPNLDHMLRAPRAFALRLLVLAREHVDAARLVQRDPQEALYLATMALGALLVDLNKTPLDKMTPEQRSQVRERAAAVEEAAGAIRRAAEEANRKACDGKEGGR